MHTYTLNERGQQNQSSSIIKDLKNRNQKPILTRTLDGSDMETNIIWTYKQLKSAIHFTINDQQFDKIAYTSSKNQKILLRMKLFGNII